MISRENALKSLNEIIQLIQELELFKATSAKVKELKAPKSAFKKMLQSKKDDQQTAQNVEKENKKLKALKNIFNVDALLLLQKKIADESIALYDGMGVDVGTIYQNTYLLSNCNLVLADKSDLDTIKAYKAIVQNTINSINENLHPAEEKAVDTTHSLSSSSSSHGSLSGLSPDSGFEILSPSQLALANAASASSLVPQSKATLLRNKIIENLRSTSDSIDEAIAEYEQSLDNLSTQKTALTKQATEIKNKQTKAKQLAELQARIQTINKTEINNTQALKQMQLDRALMSSLKASLVALELEDDTFEFNLKDMQTLLIEFKKTHILLEKQDLATKLRGSITAIEKEIEDKKRAKTSPARLDLTPASFKNSDTANPSIKSNGTHSGKFIKPASPIVTSDSAAVSHSASRDPFADLTTAISKEQLLDLSTFFMNSSPVKIAPTQPEPKIDTPALEASTPTETKATVEAIVSSVSQPSPKTADAPAEIKVAITEETLSSVSQPLPTSAVMTEAELTTSTLEEAPAAATAVILPTSASVDTPEIHIASTATVTASPKTSPAPSTTLQPVVTTDADEKEGADNETKTPSPTAKVNAPAQSETLLNQILEQLNKTQHEQQKHIDGLKQKNLLLLAQNKTNTQDIAQLKADEEKIKNSYLKSSSARAHIPGAITEKQTQNKNNADKFKQNKNTIQATTQNHEIVTDLIEQLNKLHEELQIYKTDLGFGDDYFCKDLLILKNKMAVFYNEATQEERLAAQSAISEEIRNMRLIHAPVAIRQALLAQQKQETLEAEEEEKNATPLLIEKIQRIQVLLSAAIVKSARILKEYYAILRDEENRLTREELAKKYTLIMKEENPESPAYQKLVALNRNYHSNYLFALKKDPIFTQMNANMAYIIDALDQFPNHKKIRAFSQQALHSIPEEGTPNFHNLTVAWAKEYRHLAQKTLAAIASNKTVKSAPAIMVASPKPLSFGQKLWRNKFSILLTLAGATGAAAFGFFTIGLGAIPLIPFIAAVSGIGIGGGVVSGLLGMGADALLRPADEMIMQPLKPEDAAQHNDNDNEHGESNDEQYDSSDEMEHTPVIHSIVRRRPASAASSSSSSGSSRTAVDARVSQHRQGFMHHPQTHDVPTASTAPAAQENRRCSR